MGPISAAVSPGTATVTTPTPPTSVSGLTIRGVTSARDGGIYFAYENSSGDDYTLVKQQADKTYDQTFGTNGAITIPGMLVTSQRRVAVMSDLNNKWWSVASSGGLTGDLAKVSVGGPTGLASQKTFSSAELSPLCATAFPGSTAISWSVSFNSVLAKRNGGAWGSLSCTGRGNFSVSVEPTNALALFALKEDLTIDSTIAAIGLVAANGSTAACHGMSGLVSDPTGAATSPEVWVLRFQHTNIDRNGLCESNRDLTAAKITGYDVMRISSTGTISRTDIASPGDDVDSLFSMRLDPGGRPLLVGTALSDNTKLVMARIKTDGSLDTSSGTNGFTTLSVGALPTGAVSMRGSVMGIITAKDTVYVSIMLSDQSQDLMFCADSTPVTYGYRVMIVSYAKGIATTFGTNGVGERVSHTVPFSDNCSFRSGGSSVANSGTPRVAYKTGSDLFLAEWARPSDATGGSDGGTGTGGYTTDTGGAPSRGEGGEASASRTDNKVYSRKLPTTTQEGTALKVLTKKASRTQMLRSTTPKICVTLTESVVLVDEGRCRVQIVNKSDRRVVRSLSTRVKSDDVQAGTTVEVEDAIPFAQVSTRLSKSAREQVVELAESAATAKRIILVGHTALLTEATVSNNFISLQRAAAVKAALQAEFKKAGVNVPISITALGSRAPLTTRSSEAAQSRNRRVDIYVMP
jgi:outer membrane protein OmpA-like peptidoglycan-associated protein